MVVPVVGAEKAKELFLEKVRVSDEYAKKQTLYDPKNARFFWVGSRYKPEISAKVKGQIVKSTEESDAVLHSDTLKLWGGDIVSAKITVNVFPSKRL